MGGGGVFLFYSVFLSAVEGCVTQPHLLGELFEKHRRRLHMYVVYCRNKPSSELIVSNNDEYFEVTFFFVNKPYE